jgi:hypothetical protein
MDWKDRRGQSDSSRIRQLLRKRRALVVGLVAFAVLIPAGATALRSQTSPLAVLRAEGPARAAQGGDVPISKPRAVMAERGQLKKPVVISKPTELHLNKAHGAVFDVRALKSTVVRRERPEHPAPGQPRAESTPDPGASLPGAVDPKTIGAASPNTPAPSPDASFEGLDFANWGAGHPPDTNGDVGPSYYIQTINTSIGIYDKSNGSRVAAFTFDAFMSQGNFGNLCDTDNFGDPVVVYDSFEDRWIITDFAFVLDGSGNVSPQHVFECFAASKTGDPVSGGWNFYSIETLGGLGDYPKFGIWPDGLYMSANMFGYSSSGSFIAPRVWAIDKAQMYAGEPTVQVADFDAPADDFTLLPANARLQAGTPPPGTANYFVSTSDFLNAVGVYKLHVDWDKISTSTFTGPDVPLNATSWPNANVGEAPTPGNDLDTLEIRAMAQLQYSNIGGSESLWASHTVRRADTSGSAAPRWYQLNVSGGTVAANTVQGTTWDPDGANTFYRFMPSLAVDRMGDMALGYSKSNATTNPQIKYAGRLAGDPANTFSQTEQTLIDGTGTQTGNCGSSTCTRWGDYSGMALDPDGCEFWMTNEYYQANGLNHHTRIGSFKFPGCTTVGSGTLSGTVTDGSNPIAGATLALGNRTTTTNGSGNYSFSIPAGTYASITASKAGFDAASASSIAVPDGGTATRNFTLNAAASSGCFADNTQTAFQRGIPSNCDLTASPGNVILANPITVDQQNSDVSPSGFGFTNTSWAGQTFTPAVSGKLKRVDVELFCSGCSGTNPDITVSLRATTGATPVPTGADLATATLPGFDDGGAGGLKSVTFSTPATVTAGTRYAFIFRSTAARTGTYAYTCSCATTGFANTNPYANGQRVTSTNSGSTWAADTTVGGRDLNFATYIDSGFAPSGALVSSVKDANPAAGRTATWSTLSFTATKPAGTDVKFQVAASNSSYGPFTFVGPDGTAGTFFTTSGASLSQFNGFRYLRYKAYLSTGDGSVTPALSSVTVCFSDIGGTATSLVVDSASGTYGGTADLTATLTAGGVGVSGETVGFTLNGSSVGSAPTNAGGVATLNAASLAGINAGTYPTGVGASFAGDAVYDTSNDSDSLTIGKASQTIGVTTHAPASAIYNTSFGVAANAPGGVVSFSSAGVCSNVGATFTMTSGTGTCTVKYDQAGNTNYVAAPPVTDTATAQKAAQAIGVTTHAPPTAGFATGFTVAATGGGSANPVTFSNAGVCTNVGATFTMTSSTGTCTVKYDQAGDANYAEATQVTDSVTAQKANQTIAVTTHAPAGAVYNSSFTVAASGSGSGNAVTFSSGGVCTNVGSTFTMTSGTGTCTVNYDQAGSANYAAAQQVTESVTAQKANQTITVTTQGPQSAVYNTSFGVAANAAGGVVSFSAAGACSNSGNTLTMTSGTGTCTLTYDQAGDANYAAAPQVTESVTAQKAGQTITFSALPDRTLGDSDFGPGATASSGLAIDYSASGNCSIASGKVHITGVGSCTVTAAQAGNANFNAASSVAQSFTIANKVVPPKCTVPKVVGKMLSAAKLALKARHCGTGKVTKAYSKKIKKGKVSAQSRRAGQVLAAGTKVNLVVSKGRKPRPR